MTELNTTVNGLRVYVLRTSLSTSSRKNAGILELTIPNLYHDAKGADVYRLIEAEVELSAPTGSGERIMFGDAIYKPVGPGYVLIRKSDGKPVRVRAVRAGGDDGAFSGEFLTATDGRFPYASPIPIFGS